MQDGQGHDLGPWEPLRVQEAVRLFTGAPFRCWVTGGHALELHLGTSWRRHDDLDVGIRRQDADHVYRWLSDWDVFVAAEGRLTAWRGQPLDADRNHNNLWCRTNASAPWQLDIVVGAGSDDHWIYRRDEQVTRPWDQAVLWTADNIPYLAPELQLLFKSQDPRDKDHVDAQHVIPRMEAARRRSLARLLPPQHPWQHLLGRGRRTPSTPTR